VVLVVVTLGGTSQGNFDIRQKSPGADGREQRQLMDVEHWLVTNHQVVPVQNQKHSPVQRVGGGGGVVGIGTQGVLWSPQSLPVPVGFAQGQLAAQPFVIRDQPPKMGVHFQVHPAVHPAAGAAVVEVPQLQVVVVVAGLAVVVDVQVSCELTVPREQWVYVHSRLTVPQREG